MSGNPGREEVVGQDYYLLGAGFSRAINSLMPTLSDLQPAVLKELVVEQETLLPFGNNLEEWMSYLSVEQPWVTDQDNLRNAATFLDASHAVRTCIREAEALALLDEPPEWLTRLVWHWCDTSSAIATFNYDLLVERTASHLRRVGHWSDIYALPLTERWPAGSSRAISASSPAEPVFRMFKLHGSTNWAYGGPKAPASDRIVLTQPKGSWQSDPSEREARSTKYASLFDDLAPLIIPPTSSKGGFYNNLSLRAQWRQAARSLSNARSLTVIGYSFPPSDLGARHFVSTSLGGGPVTVVDYCEDTARRTEQLLGRDRDVTVICGEYAVKDFVEQRCGQLIKWGIKYQPESAWQPYIDVNGKDALTHLAEPPVPATVAADSRPSIAWVEAEVLRRWPTITKHANTDYGSTGTHAKVAYLLPAPTRH